MYLATSLSSSMSWLSLTSPTSVTSGETIQGKYSIIHVLNKLNKLCKNNTILNNLLVWADLLTRHHLTVSLTGFSVGSIEYYLWNFGQLAYFRLTIHKHTHLPSSNTVSDRVCRWFDRVFSVHLYAVSLLPVKNPQIYSFAIARHCPWQVLPLVRSSIRYGTLGSWHNTD